MSGASVAIVIVNYRSSDMTLGALRAVAAQRADLPGLRAVVVDGGSGDGSAERLAHGLADPCFAGWASLLPLAINGGFGWANNQAMLHLLQGDNPPDYIHLLNPDTLAEPGAIKALADTLDADPGCGAVGSLLLDSDGTPSGCAFRFPTVPREFLRGARIVALGPLLRIKPVLVEIGKAGPVDWVTGASVMLRAAALRQSGLFDDGFFLYFEEVEMMWRMRRQGWTIRHVPESRILHVGGATTGVELPGRTSERLPRLPRYWFESRRRFWTRTHGPRGAVFASLAWLLGHWIALTLGRLRKRQVHVDRAARDMIRYGISATALDRASAARRWTDPAGSPPAWMASTDPA